MTPDGRHAAGPTPDEHLAEVAQDREQLLAAIRDAEPALTGPWRVVRQYNDLPEQEICAHRYEWGADLCAYRRTARHAHEIGAHFTVRRAES